MCFFQLPSEALHMNVNSFSDIAATLIALCLSWNIHHVASFTTYSVHVVARDKITGNLIWVHMLQV